MRPLDSLDRQLLAALQVDGRASWRRLAEVLGTSDQTVARRWTRLRTEGRARVLGLTDPGRLGQAMWFLRARTTPDAALPIAQALARRPETSWVSLTSGGTEIACSTRASTDSDVDELLLQRIPRTQRIVDVSAHALLHVFFGFSKSPLLKRGDLAADQLAALAADVPAPPADDAVVELDDVDHALLVVLHEDGRTPLDDLAARTGTPETTVRRRLAALRAAGVLYFDLDLGLDPARGGETTRPTLMWLSVRPHDLAAVGEALAEHPEVAYAAATTGSTNVFASLVPTDGPALYRYLTGAVAALPDVLHIETAPVIRLLKGAGAPSPPTR